MKHRLDTPSATMAALLGFLVLVRAERQRMRDVLFSHLGTLRFTFIVSHHVKASSSSVTAVPFRSQLPA